MTSRRDFKQRVRDRAARTGERYTEAREHVLAGRGDGPPFPVVEMTDLGAAAAAAGLRCGVTASAAVVARGDGAALVARLRDALIATIDDPATLWFRRVALAGERDVAPRTTAAGLDSMRAYFARVKAGLGGVSEGGTMLALQTEGGPVLAILYAFRSPLVPPSCHRPASIVLVTLDDLDIVPGAFLAVR